MAEWILVVCTVLGLFVAAIAWMYRVTRDMDINNHFVRSMASNHLPHVYHTLSLICHKLEIEVTEPPPIEFVDLEKK